MNFMHLITLKTPQVNDNIAINSINNCAEILNVPLAFIFNTSINKSVFSDLMKLAKVCPVHKGGDLFSVSNYRPVSLLPTFLKVFEKIICQS